MVNDPLGDLLARIKNAQMRRKQYITLPTSNMINAVVNVLKNEGFIIGFRIQETEPSNLIEIELKYENKQPVIRELKRVSKPGIRKYKGYKDIKPVKNGLGISIVSTPKGIMTGKDAVESHIGGEILCEIF